MITVDRDKTFATYSEADWRDLFDKVFAYCVEALKRRGSLPVTYLGLRDIYGRPDLQIVNTEETLLPRVSHEKQLWVLKRTVHTMNLCAYIIVAEAWGVAYQSAEEHRVETERVYARHPRRQERLVALLVTKAGLKLHHQGLIVRFAGDPGGPVIDVKPDEPGYDLTIGGALAQLFDR